ncbi:MAG: hypothetical protein ABFS45_27215 [Pseudomonadota bacterium]
MHTDATYIFYGECISNTVDTDQTTGLEVTYTTFSILEAIKGKLDQTHTIKQVGSHQPGGTTSGIIFPGVPRFEEGTKYILFLPPASHIGFSSPVGLGQGVFSVDADDAGNDVVSNGRDFTELLKNVPPDKVQPHVIYRLKSLRDQDIPTYAKSRAQLPLDDFLSILQSMKIKP